MTWTVEEIWRYYLEQAITRKAQCEADIERLSTQLDQLPPPVFDVGDIQHAIIEQLHQTARSNNYEISMERHDGWYRYNGSIDTRYLAEAVLKALERPTESTDAAMGSGKAMK